MHCYTLLFQESSRSHAVFTIILEHEEYSSGGGRVVTIGKLRLVDLAGSERCVCISQHTDTHTNRICMKSFMYHMHCVYY